MAWEKPQYTNSDYNKAGLVLLSGDLPDMSLDKALTIINNWRSSHYHPLNTFQLRLRRKAQEIDSNSLIAQRIKRLPSIKHKLERFGTMRLIQMQDIGGCRAILSSIDHLDKLVAIIASKDKKRSSRGLKHKLVEEKDYIRVPKTSGYRGVHLVFKYRSDKAGEWNDLKIEIQFRTFLQHAWATAVETVGIFIGQALKSSMGHEDWLRFFSLASSAIALIEGAPTVPGIQMTPDQLRAELRRYVRDLGVISHLETYSSAIRVINDSDMKGAHYYLLELHAADGSMKIRPYKQKQLQIASEHYLQAEKNAEEINMQVVLVAADSLTSLQKAYPNYFVDTKLFVSTLKQIIA